MIRYYWYKILRKIGGAGIKNSIIGFDSKVEAGSVFVNSIMGRHSFCGYDCCINNTEIGSFVSIADRVYIGRGIHPISWVSTSPVFYDNKDSVKVKYSKHKRDEHPKTYIGNDFWIGDGVFVKPGIKIADGAVVGMGSVVTKDVPPYAIVAGNPARIIRYRFSQDVVNELCNSKWWDLQEDDMRKLARNINNPEAFLHDLRSIR